MIGIPVGILSAVKRDSALDHFHGFLAAGRFDAGFLVRAPVAVYFCHYRLKWLPVSGFYGFKYVIPASYCAFGLEFGRRYRALLPRSSLLQVMQKRLCENSARACARFSSSFAMPLKCSYSRCDNHGNQVAGLLSGAVITEAIFGDRVLAAYQLTQFRRAICLYFRGRFCLPLYWC